MQLTGRWRLRRNWRGKMIYQVEVANVMFGRSILDRFWMFRWRDARLTDMPRLLEIQGARDDKFTVKPSVPRPPD